MLNIINQQKNYTQPFSGKTHKDTVVNNETVGGYDYPGDQSLATEPLQTFKAEKEEDYIENDIKTFWFPKTYSPSYVTFNTKNFIEKIIKELTYWETLGLDEAIGHVANIKDTLQYYSEYLLQEPETRILFSLIQLIVKEKNWEKLSTSKIKQLRVELERFKIGVVSFSQLNSFSKQIFRERIYRLQNEETKGKEKGE